MASKVIKSRIHQYFSKELLEKLYKICQDKRISDNNIKSSIVIETLDAYDIDFNELGPGTNRVAVLIDGYVFKIALDRWGCRDNLNEFAMSQELQPYVTKTYETNEIITVSEYVTLITKEEFVESTEAVRNVLSILADSYLLGDVGTVKKNFANWGYRDNGDLVILDFAYIYRIYGEEILCSKDSMMLEYDQNFHSFICPQCKTKYTFMDVRRKVTMEQEETEINSAKRLAYKLTSPAERFEVKSRFEEPKKFEEEVEEEPIEEEIEEYPEEELDTEEAYLKVLEEMRQRKKESGELFKPVKKVTDEEPTPYEKALASLRRQKEEGTFKDPNREEMKMRRRYDNGRRNEQNSTLTAYLETLESLRKQKERMETLGDANKIADEIYNENRQSHKPKKKHHHQRETKPAEQVKANNGRGRQIPQEEFTKLRGDVSSLVQAVFTIDDEAIKEEFINKMTGLIARYDGVKFSDFMSEIEEEAASELEEENSLPVLEPAKEKENVVVRSLEVHDGDNKVDVTSAKVESPEVIKVPEAQEESSIDVANEIEEESVGDKVDNDEAERQELISALGLDDEEEEKDRYEELAEDYMHLQDEVYDEMNQKGTNKSWK